MGGWEGELCCGQPLQMDTNTAQLSHDEVAVLNSRNRTKTFLVITWKRISVQILGLPIRGDCVELVSDCVNLINLQ